MEYLYPDYYGDFHCIASACEATCCAGWQIAVDEKSLEKYKKVKGSFGNRLKNCINWKEQTFEQSHRRCAFLNEENLCDLYSELGAGALCKTCRRYPRHIEEFENSGSESCTWDYCLTEVELYNKVAAAGFECFYRGCKSRGSRKRLCSGCNRGW